MNMTFLISGVSTVTLVILFTGGQSNYKHGLLQIFVVRTFYLDNQTINIITQSYY